jgi:hypothetical protein
VADKNSTEAPDKTEENCPKSFTDRVMDLRVLIDEFGGVVDLIVDNNVKIPLGVVLGNVLVGELLGSHFCDCWEGGESRSN